MYIRKKRNENDGPSAMLPSNATRRLQRFRRQLRDAFYPMTERHFSLRQNT